ncbi:hypothetical protein [Lentzea flava]|uniref:Uncharacterized protein n=1 Tax=Lentzea flava TaxID=103732 RepID=A0ABQ2VIT9_9PSEU|nr:hypothetical protein [Lentzea flava]MCP2205268.1 hypothetical protein [Lentzea flava]GGU85306.1 hypothetical protein GCM10010178_89370 [Lentzea flava]
MTGELIKRNTVVLHDDFRMSPEAEISKDVAKLRDLRRELRADESAGVIDKCLSSITSTPEGVTRSPLTDAVLYEGLRTGQIEHVLVVKANAGSVGQLLDNRPLWLKDRVFVRAAMSVNYLLLDAKAKRIVVAGTMSGKAKINRKIGAEL